MNEKDNLLEGDSQKGPQMRPKRKGRSNKLVEKRNKCLLSRYYYYNNYTVMRYDVIMDKLGEEFFLSRSTIQDLVQEHADYLEELKRLHPRKAYFNTQWPHLVWE